MERNESSKLFTGNPLNDSFLKALKLMNSVNQGSTNLTQEEVERQRASMEKAAKLATMPVGVETESFTVGDIQAERVKPGFVHDSRHIILYCHGGGYTCGGLKYARILAAKLAFCVGLEVISFEYRLAPEHKYPAALDDGMAMWDYLMYMGYGASDIIVAGDSAGGNMALEILLKLKATGRKMPRALMLFSPWTDMTATSGTYEEHAGDDPILSHDFIVSARNAYIGEDADPSDVRYSPVGADFTGFPPTLIQVGRLEILLDDSRSLRKKMLSDGVRVTYQKYNNGWHVFQQMPLPMAHEAMQKACEFVYGIIYA